MVRLKYATPRQIVALAVAWAALLFGVDYALNPRPLKAFFTVDHEHAAASVMSDKPRLRLAMKHLCSSECVGEISQALLPITWAGAVQVTKSGGRPDSARDVVPGPIAPGDELEVDIKDVKSVDFMEVVQAVRSIGLSIEQIRFSGLTHFRLEAELPHLCAGRCTNTLNEGLRLEQGQRAAGRFVWLDSAVVQEARKTVVLYARYGYTVDVSEIVLGLNALGYEPKSIRVRTGDST